MTAHSLGLRTQSQFLITYPKTKNTNWPFFPFPFFFFHLLGTMLCFPLSIIFLFLMKFKKKMISYKNHEKLYYDLIRWCCFLKSELDYILTQLEQFF